MDQQRRLLVFGLVSFLTFYGWLFLGPQFFPDMFPKPPEEVAEVDGVDPAEPQQHDPAAGLHRIGAAFAFARGLPLRQRHLY